jgi:hypothetical protein
LNFGLWLLDVLQVGSGRHDNTPLGLVVEALEGPIAGSKFFNYYTPKGNKTGVTVIGDFKSPSNVRRST